MGGPQPYGTTRPNWPMSDRARSGGGRGKRRSRAVQTGVTETGRAGIRRGGTRPLGPAPGPAATSVRTAPPGQAVRTAGAAGGGLGYKGASLGGAGGKRGGFGSRTWAITGVTTAATVLASLAAVDSLAVTHGLVRSVALAGLLFFGVLLLQRCLRGRFVFAASFGPSCSC